MTFIPYGRQSISQNDRRAVDAVLRSSYLTTGPSVSKFETALARYVQARHGISFSSGTAALHGAVFAAGVGPGDEVLVPALSFVATANAVLYLGAKPVFVDSSPGRFNLDPKDAAKKITRRTKAIIAVHFAGEPAPMAEIRALAKKHRLVVIEDAAHALGARYKGKKVGSLSDMTVFSFHPVKHITTGEGGMVTTNKPALKKRLLSFRNHGIDQDAQHRQAKKTYAYDMRFLGFNYRLTDIQSALGYSQLKRVEKFLRARERVVSQYKKAFQGLARVELPPLIERGNRHAWHLFVLRVPKRDRVFKALRKRGIGVNVHYLPIYKHSYYQKHGFRKQRCPNLERTFQTMLTLPLFHGMTPSMVKTVIREVRRATQKK